MVYKVDTKNKTIEIEEASGEEIIELANKYKNYKFKSVYNTQFIPYTSPNTNIYETPYYISGVDPYTTNKITTS